jgi:hypothetical protein
MSETVPDGPRAPAGGNSCLGVATVAATAVLVGASYAREAIRAAVEEVAPRTRRCDDRIALTWTRFVRLAAASLLAEASVVAATRAAIRRMCVGASVVANWVKDRAHSRVLLLAVIAKDLPGSAECA